MKDDDYEIEKIVEGARELAEAVICGPDAAKLAEKLSNAMPEKKYLLPCAPAMTAESLILITEDLIAKGAEPLKDFDGPVYLRASEAELKLNGTIS